MKESNELRFQELFEKVLNDLELNYAVMIDEEDDQKDITEDRRVDMYILGFKLGYYKKLDNNYRYELLVYLDSKLATMSFIVDEVINLPLEFEDNIDIYKIINLLNVSTIYGNVFCDEKNNKLAINYSHTVNVEITYSSILENVKKFLSYINFFVQEILGNFINNFGSVGFVNEIEKERKYGIKPQQ